MKLWPKVPQFARTLGSRISVLHHAATRSAPLNAATIFTVLATLRVMSEPVRMLPEVLSVLIQVKVSLDRIDIFLQEEEVKEDDVKRSPLQNSNLVAEISNGVFSWDQTYASPTLRNINLQIERGQKIAVCGAVGSGKSSLLYALLGEIPKISGSVCVNGSIAYVPQTSWIQSGTLRDNILYGKPMKNEAYRKAIRCCALDKDVENFDHGDLTEIGQRGLNMSGGQKQRIQLARAVYSDADIYILDDPFSAVDAHTASILFHDCVMAALEKKTVILVTHQVEFLPQTDLILVMEGGRVIQTGRYEELLMAGTTFEQLVTAHRSSVTTLNSTDRLPTMAGDPLKQSGEGEISIKGVVSAVQLTEEEQTETGNSGWKPYKDYIQVSKGSFLLALILISQSIFIILQSLSFYWLASAVQIHRISDAMLVVVFSTVSLASCIFLIARSLFTAQLGLRASKQFFSGFMDSVFKAPMTFFDSTPIGRILTRASSDLCILDFDIPYSISFMLVGAIEVVTTIAIIATVTWQVLLEAVPVLIFMIYVQNYYLASSRELVRINGTTKAPVMNFAGESLLGVVTVRAFGTVERFFRANLKLIDTDAKLFFHTAGVMEWVLLRVEALQSLTILASTVFLVFLPQGTIAPAPELEAGGKPASHGGLKDELRILRREEGLSKITTKTTTTTTTKTVAGLSPSSASAGGEEEFLLPEFNELVLKDFETSCKELDSTHSTPARSDSKEDCSSVEQEISQLKNLVFSLQERERNLELQLPECSGMLQREAAARELESQMKIHNMESQLFLLKIESLQSENQRLQALVLDHSRVMGELDTAKGKIKSLKRKAKLDGEQAREKISSLHQMIGGLQNKERDDLEMERMLKELEGEAGSLGRRNSSLAVENLELKLKLESVETIFNSAMGGRKAEELEEVQQLKQSNDKLSKEVEQLQITRCSDVEELVYLRWVNACLRYELRNYQPPQGKMAARDLSKNLSPRSEEKAKQLILEYANSHTDGKGALSPGDLDDYSSSHASTGESDDVFLEDPSVNPKHGSSKSKLFSKLKKLVLGKDHRSSRVNDTFGRDSFESFSSSVTEEIGAVGQTPVDGLLNDERGGSGKHARPRKSLMDFQRLRRILLKGRERKGDSLKRAVSEDCLMGSAHSKVDGNRENEIPERKELRKYAEVLRGSHGAQMAFRKSTSSAIDDYLL